MANVRIDGLKDLGTRVKNMGKDARAAAGQALRKGAEIIREEAHVRAPRSAHGHPATQGRTAKHLADQLTTSASASKYTAGVTVVGGVNGPSYYWKYLEYGTKRIRERAFIRESAEARGDEASPTSSGVYGCIKASSSWSRTNTPPATIRPPGVSPS